jgi:hypothetical protein
MRLSRIFGIWGMTAALCLSAGTVFAQDGSNSNSSGGGQPHFDSDTLNRQAVHPTA